VYANQARQDSEYIRNKIKNRNNANSFNSGVPLKRNDINSDSSNEYSNAIFYFIIVFIANVVKYDARDVKD